jgi:hypothetical protein
MEEERAITAKPCGMKKQIAPRTQRKSEEGPFAAASAIHRIPTMAATLKRTMSRVLSARSRAMDLHLRADPLSPAGGEGRGEGGEGHISHG